MCIPLWNNMVVWRECVGITNRHRLFNKTMTFIKPVCYKKFNFFFNGLEIYPMIPVHRWEIFLSLEVSGIINLIIFHSQCFICLKHTFVYIYINNNYYHRIPMPYRILLRWDCNHRRPQFVHLCPNVIAMRNS